MKLRIKIKPLTKKMKDKVKQHGDVWEHQPFELEGEEILLSTIHGVHDRGEEPYRVWTKPGIDFEVIAHAISTYGESCQKLQCQLEHLEEDPRA